MAKGYKTGGRRKGTPNRATVERQLRTASGLRSAVEEGLLPLDIMLRRMRGDTSITDGQSEAAVAAAPYVHPKLAAVAVQEDTNDLSQISDEQLEALIRASLRELTVGEPSLVEAVPLAAYARGPHPRRDSEAEAPSEACPELLSP